MDKIIRIEWLRTKEEKGEHFPSPSTQNFSNKQVSNVTGI